MKKLRMFTIISLLITNIMYIVSNLGIQVVQAAEEEAISTWSVSGGVDTIEFPVIIRDFRMDYVLFEGESKQIPWLGAGMVAESLDKNKNPIFTEEAIGRLAQNLNDNIAIICEKNESKNTYYKDIFNRILKNEDGKEKEKNQRLGSYADAKTAYESNQLNMTNIDTCYEYIYYMMNSWFNDVNGAEDLNIQDKDTIIALTLNRQDEGKYTFDSGSGFFPVDNKGFGNEQFAGWHNFHFTLESHSSFSFDGKDELTFNFSGDDDVWVYLDGKLVIDLGGVHSKKDASFTIKKGESNEKYGIVSYRIGDIDKEFRIEINKLYDFDFFYMERHTAESNLKIETNIKFIPKMSVSKSAYLLDDNNEKITLTSDSYAYPGETIYYEFELTNDGNVPLTNIEFVDQMLGVTINESGVNKGDSKIDVSDLEITKKDKDDNVVGNGLDALKSLNVGETVVVQGKELLKYLVTDNDVAKGIVENIVVSTATHEESGTSLKKDGQASIKVKIKDIPITPEQDENKININITKNIEKVSREEKIIFKRENGLTFTENLYPGDKVEFSFDITNKSKTPNGTAVAVENLSLKDEFTNYKTNTDNWEFYLINNQGQEEKIDINNFSIGKGETIKIIAKAWTVPSKLKYDSNGELITSEINTATLYKKTGDKNTEISKSSVNMTLKPLTLKVKKVVENATLADLTNTTFTLKLIGKGLGENGKEVVMEQFNIEAKADKEYTFTNLTYGLTYELSEIVPMNYELVSTCFKNNLSSNESSTTIKMSTLTNGYVGVVTNKYVNNNLFYDSSNKKNTIKYDAVGN